MPNLCVTSNDDQRTYDGGVNWDECGPECVQDNGSDKPPQTCLTKNKKPCVIPFKYQKKEYNGCASGGSIFKTTYWCPTRSGH